MCKTGKEEAAKVTEAVRKLRCEEEMKAVGVLRWEAAMKVASVQ